MPFQGRNGKRETKVCYFSQKRKTQLFIADAWETGTGNMSVRDKQAREPD
jgi:hypothetical protein